MKNYSKFFKILMFALILVSVGILVMGFLADFDDSKVELLLKWTYVMVGIAVAAVIIMGLIISVANNPKSLIKLAGIIVGVGAVCVLAYVLAPGNPAVGLITDQPEGSTLKLTDTILNLTYLAAGAAIVSIVIGEIVAAIRNK